MDYVLEVVSYDKHETGTKYCLNPSCNGLCVGGDVSYNPTFNDVNVLILLVMDYVLEVVNELTDVGIFACLNPSCNGLCVGGLNCQNL